MDEYPAIADVLWHPELGLVSYQPNFKKDPDDNAVPVRDINFKLHKVKLSDLSEKDITRKEIDRYRTAVRPLFTHSGVIKKVLET